MQGKQRNVLYYTKHAECKTSAPGFQPFTAPQQPFLVPAERHAACQSLQTIHNRAMPGVRYALVGASAFRLLLTTNPVSVKSSSTPALSSKVQYGAVVLYLVIDDRA
jgi:hypothetical protein